MSEIEHSTIEVPEIHGAGYMQDDDPGAVGAGIQWIDTTGGGYLLKIRNAGNSGWETLGSPSLAGPTVKMALAQHTSVYTYNATPKLGQYNSVSYDPSSTITTGSSWKWTAPANCMIACSASSGFADGRWCALQFRVNGGTVKTSLSAPVNSQPNNVHNLLITTMTSGQYLQCWWYSQDGWSFNSTTWSFFQIMWIED